MTQTPTKIDQIDIKAFYERLAQFGLKERYVREKLLPDWWDKEFEKTQGAVVEAAAYVSGRINLDITSLLQVDTQPKFKETCKHSFKVREGTGKDQLIVVQGMADRIAELITYACIPNAKSLDGISAITIRDEILTTERFVTLEGLLKFCWHYGVPVAYSNKFPNGQKKFDGMVGCFYERPAIVISRKHTSPAWLSFILAHELGHIVKGHVKDMPIIDQDIKPDAGETDIQEIEANDFAVELLFGKKEADYSIPSKLASAALVNYAQECSEKDAVDPSAVILNYAWHKANLATTKRERGIVWATATNSLKVLEESVSAPLVTINSYLTQQHLDWDRLSDDNQEYLELMIEV
jgi:Zn-dependent peptidase ImmA (M78 family)